MSTRTPATRSSCCCARCSAAGIRSPRSATRASPSTAGAAPARATCAGSPHDFPAKAGERAPVRLLSTSFRNAGRVLDAAATLQAELRAEAPDVPLLAPAPGRGDRGGVTAALLPTAVDEADWVADQAAALLALPLGSAPDGRPWPDGAARRRPPVRHRGAVQEAVAVRGAAPGAGGARRIPCEVVGLGGLLIGPRGAGRGGDAAGAARRLRVGRAGPAADRPALADRPARPGGPRPPRPRPGQGRRRPGRRPAQLGPEQAPSGRPRPHPRPDRPGLMIRRARGRARGRPRRRPADRDALTEALTDLTAETGSLVEALDDLGDPAGYSQPATPG